MMKELYLKPEVELNEFDVNDIIVTSGEGVVANNPEDGWSNPA